MDGHHPPPSHQPAAAQPERRGSFDYDIENTDASWRGAHTTSEALLRYDDDGPREPLLRKRTMNTTSQIAIVGANVCPIESLDYEYVQYPPGNSANPLLSVFPSIHIICSSRENVNHRWAFLH
jgi:chloride channel 7